MIPRGVKLAHVALLAFSALLAFLILRALDEEVTLGGSATIQIMQSDNSVASSEVIGMVESFADDHGVNIGNEAADLNDPGNRRNLYMAVGDPDAPSASWLADGYPGFSRDFRTEVQPLDEINRLDPRGYYVVFGTPQAADELLAQFEKLGFSGEVTPGVSLSESVQFFANGALLWCFLIVPLAAVIVIGSSVILNAKAYGVLRLQGKSFAQILLRDMAQLAAFWVRAAGVVSVGVAVCLAFYNGLHRLELFGLIAAGFLAVFTLVALAAHVTALSLTYRTRIVYAIKGEVSATLVMIGAYAIRIPAMLLALAIVASAVTTGQDVAAQQTNRDAFARIGGASTILLYGNPSVEKEMDAAVGPWIQRSQSRGDVVLAVRSDMAEFTSVGQSIPEHDVLIVNNTYLAEQTVLDTSGRRVSGVNDPGSDTRAQVLLPESLSSDAERLTASITDWLKFQAKFGGTKLGTAQVEMLATKSGQKVFTYGSGMYTGRPAEALVRDPIIVVVPGNSGIFDNQQYVAYATQSGVIFRDPEDVRAAMSTDAGRYVIAMSPVAQHAADEYQDLIREFRLNLFNAAAALAVLLITSISVSLIYRRKNAQALFVKYISGWPFLKAYRSLLAIEGALALALVGGISWKTWNEIRALRELEAAGMSPIPGEGVTLDGWAPAAMLAIAVLSVIVVIITVLAGPQNRSVRQRIVEE